MKPLVIDTITTESNSVESSPVRQYDLMEVSPSTDSPLYSNHNSGPIRRNSFTKLERIFVLISVFDSDSNTPNLHRLCIFPESHTVYPSRVTMGNRSESR